VPPVQANSRDVVEFLEALERGEEGAGDLDAALARARGATEGQKCALPTGTSLLMQSLFLSFEEEFRAHAGRPCPSPRGLILPKIVDWRRATRIAEIEPRDHRGCDSPDSRGAFPVGS
jgi:hypothetical protein